KLIEAIDTGRLDLAENSLQQLGAVGGDSAEAEPLARGLGQCRRAWNLLETGDAAGASEILRRLAMVFPAATWIQAALQHVKQANAALSELRGGPLALLSCSTDVSPVQAAERLKPQMPGQDARPTGDAGPLPQRFMLRVDGVGSFCVFRQPAVTIGPLSSSVQPDLGLMAEPGVPIATIERREDDYFIRGTAVAVNDRPGAGKLLAAGDRIALSPRCRMSFQLPSAASTTAVLDLTGCRYPRADVRRIILLDRDVILGPSLAAHVRVPEIEENLVLHVRGGRLFCESTMPVEVNGAPMDRIAGIAMEATIKVGAVTFVVSGQ
ncbi:MAG TPA: hypothetical protein VGJ09_04260, partial [Bryobacteraceae bacterium]